MKVNTDGVLLGALVGAVAPAAVLDIGTGTGVIALMLAQRFPLANIHAVEIDAAAAQTAKRNFKVSAFRDRLKIFSLDFKDFFDQYPKNRYDLMVSNPPFHLHSLKPATRAKILARHTDEDFFKDLLKKVAEHLTEKGTCQLILPLQAANVVKALLTDYGLYLQKLIIIRSFAETDAHREILTFGRNNNGIVYDDLIIYSKPKVYSDEYRELLKDFLTIF